MEQEHDINELDTLLVQHAGAFEHVPDIRQALQKVGIPLDAHEVSELIALSPRLGPGPFRGFGTTPKEHEEAASSLHAIRMMLKSHHDEPWDDDDYEIGGEG